ncbi:MAG: YgiQ family radical SAM protein, partial [Lentisphaerae bacterium]|nr:YgiQ family radical SAM protein [Lentisphaerota bacterium]
MTRLEMNRLGWKDLDILLVSGDAYVDHPSFGIAIIGRVLLSKGYKVGIISQPDWKDPSSLARLGRPKLACAISAGNLDSMLNIYTAARRIRKEDAYSLGGKTGLRPPHAAVVYSQLARQAFPGMTVILGGIEASLRRLAHYDYWQDKIKPSILMESKADILVYGMGEKAIIEIMDRIKEGKSLDSIKGTAIFPGKNVSQQFNPSNQYVEIPSYEEHLKDPEALLKSISMIENEMNPFCGKGVFQRHGDRIVIQESPPLPLTSGELDGVYALPFTGKPHPAYKENIPAFEMIKNSVTSVRGCPGGCSFCGLGIHQGKFTTSRSRNSIICEIRKLAEKADFHGTVSDVGGPTANTYGNKTENPELCKTCRRPSCLFPEICGNYHPYENEFLCLL